MNFLKIIYVLPNGHDSEGHYIKHLPEKDRQMVAFEIKFVCSRKNKVGATFLSNQPIPLTGLLVFKVPRIKAACTFSVIITAGNAIVGTKVFRQPLPSVRVSSLDTFCSLSTPAQLFSF